jgi:hypothetical protein
MEKSFAIQLQGNRGISFCSIDEFQKLFEIAYAPTLLFQTDNLLEKVIANTPWLLRYTVVGQEHRNFGAVLHKKMAEGRVANVAIKWIDDEIGYGVFAREDIPSQAFIGEYTGVIKQVSRFRPNLNAYCMHYPTKFFSYNYFVIDAQEAGNEMRFLNHSDRPNLKPMCVIDDGLQHIVLFASKPIASGEQLTFNYGRDYWKRRRCLPN